MKSPSSSAKITDPNKVYNLMHIGLTRVLASDRNFICLSGRPHKERPPGLELRIQDRQLGTKPLSYTGARLFILITLYKPLSLNKAVKIHKKIWNIFCLYVLTSESFSLRSLDFDAWVHCIDDKIATQKQIMVLLKRNINYTVIWLILW